MMDKISDIAKILNNFFNKEEGLKSIARKNNFIKRLRKITPINFIRSAISALASESTTSLRDYTFAFNQDSEVTLSKNAIHKKFNDNCVSFLRETLTYLCENIIFNHFEFAVLPGIHSVNVVDSSEVKLSDKLQDEFPGMRNLKSLLKVQTTIDCLQGNLNKLELTTIKTPDQKYKGFIDCIKPNSLLISDLGYFSCENMNEIKNKNAYFLTRHKKGTTYYNDKGNEISLNHMLKKFKNNIIDLNIFVSKKHKMPCRLIAIRLNENEYKKRLLNRKRQFRRKAHKSKNQQYIVTELDKWTILLTNLTKKQLKADKSWEVYAIRWQIELFFKILKGEINLTKFTHSNSSRIKAEIYLKYIILALLMVITSTITEKEISLMKAVSIIKKFCSKIFSNTRQKIYDIILNIKNYILNFCPKEQRKNRQTSKGKLKLRIKAYA